MACEKRDQTDREGKEKVTKPIADEGRMNVTPIRSWHTSSLHHLQRSPFRRIVDSPDRDRQRENESEQENRGWSWEERKESQSNFSLTLALS